MNISANLLLSGKADATNRKGVPHTAFGKEHGYMKKILVLEDEPSIRSFVVINLRRSGYEPIEAATGEQALEKLKQNPDTLVALLDVMLPDIDGFEVCRRIRATGSKMGILMLSAKSQEMDKITGLMTGAADTATSAAVRVWLTEKCSCGHAGKYGLPPGSSAVSGRSMPQTARTAYASSDTPHALPCAFVRAGRAGCASVICVQKSSIWPTSFPVSQNNTIRNFLLPQL